MESAENRFATLLTEAIHDIKRRESKNIAIIQDEIGYALGKKGGASIEYWRKGNLPRKADDVAQLVREIVARAEKDQDWLRTFCETARYPFIDALIEELFPIAPPPPLPLDQIPDPMPLPNGSYMPLRRNPLFVGRHGDLKRLAETLREGAVTAVNQAQIAAATGMGGMGKTQLASEFVHRYGQYFPGGVFWISFEDPEAIPTQIAECGGAGRLNLSPKFSELSLEEKLQIVISEWQQPTWRLLIFDNCEDEALLHHWLPKTGGCRVLVTSRSPNWDPVLGIKVLSLDVFYPHESVDLLQQLSQVEDKRMLDQIANELGHLPLALHLAGKYLHQYRNQISLEAYLEELRDPELVKHPSLQGEGISPTDHDLSVWRTFALSYDKLLHTTETDKVALDLLIGAAHFAPGEPIWSKLLIKTLAGYADDPQIQLKAHDGFLRLLGLGLIEVEKNNIYQMHRLVASFVQLVAKSEVEAVREKVEEVVFAEAAQANKDGYPIPLLAWNLHLRSVADVAKERKDARGAYLCQEIGEHLRQAGDFRGTFSYFEAALATWQALAPIHDAEVAHCYAKLGALHRAQGDLDLAKPYLDDALALYLKLFEQTHPEISVIYNEIGRWFYQQDNLEAASNHFRWAIEICEKTLGKGHRNTAEYQNNLGMCLANLGKLEEALSILEEALAIRLDELGCWHSETALSYNNVGYLLRAQEKLEEAQECYEKALKIRERVLGEKNAETGETYNNLGNLLLAQNKLEGVQAHLEKAIEAFEATYGELHDSIAFPLRNLGIFWQRSGDKAKALACFERALAIREARLEKGHRLTAVSRADLEDLQKDDSGSPSSHED